MFVFLLLLSISPPILANSNTCHNNIGNIYKAGLYRYLAPNADQKLERDRLVDALVATSTPAILQYHAGTSIHQLEGVIVTTNINSKNERLFNFLESRVKIFHNDLLVSGIRVIKIDQDLFGPTTPAQTPTKDITVTVDITPVADLKIALTFFKNNHLDTKYELSEIQTEGEKSFVFVRQKETANILYKIFIDKENFITKMVFENSGHYHELKKYLGEGLFNRNYRLSE